MAAITELLSINQPYEWYRWLPSGYGDGGLERDIDECERFYATLCRNPHDRDDAGFPVTGCATFSVVTSAGDDIDNVDIRVEGAFKNAWAMLRSECPALGSWIQFDSIVGDWRKRYTPFGDEAAKKGWLSSTFRIVTASSGEGWFNSNPPTYRLPTFFLIKHAADGNINGWRGSVALRSPHDTIDGIGILQLLDRLFELAVTHFHSGSIEGASGTTEEIDRLPLPMRVTTGIAPVPAPGLRERWGSIQVQNRTTATTKPRVGLPFNNSCDSTSGSFQRASRTLTQSDTSILTQRCKDLGITVTHALSAAIVIALRDMQSTSKNEGDVDGPSSVMRYTNNAMVNLRHMCRPRFDSLAHTVGNYHMIAAQSTAVDVPSPVAAEESGILAQRFISVAKQFRDYYRSVRPLGVVNEEVTDSELLNFAPLTWEAHTPKPSTNDTATREIEPKPALADVAISSLGNINSLVQPDRGPFSIANVWVAGVGLGTGVSMFLGGWKGTIEMSSVFSTSFHNRGDIVSLQEKVVSTLSKGLEI